MSVACSHECGCKQMSGVSNVRCHAHTLPIMGVVGIGRQVSETISARPKVIVQIKIADLTANARLEDFPSHSV
jgi:hypothetical protein